MACVMIVGGGIALVMRDYGVKKIAGTFDVFCWVPVVTATSVKIHSVAMSWFPISAATKLDLLLDGLEYENNYNFRRLFGTTSNDPESHSGRTTTALFLSMLSELGTQRR
eukprot:scaffold62706_cov48-Cyclotella_meneghiniana.AAC.8